MLDVLAELTTSSATPGTAQHPGTAANLADLVGIMNTYYTNFIEGHDTHPRDIERALARDFEHDQRRKNLQVEAAAHVRVQASIDKMGVAGELPRLYPQT